MRLHRYLRFLFLRRLDGVSAARCKELEYLATKRIGLSPPLRRSGFLTGVVFVLVFVVSLVASVIVAQLLGDLGVGRAVTGAMTAAIFLGVCLAFAVVQCRWLYRCMTQLHAQLVCDCGYPLVAAPDQTAPTGLIRQCPECGLQHRLCDLRGDEQAAATTMTTVTEPHASTKDEK